MRPLYFGVIFFSARFVFVWMIFAAAFPAAGQLPNPDYYSVYQQTGLRRDTVLVDSEGTVLHTWPSDLLAPNGATAYLREDGLLLRSAQRGTAVPAGFWGAHSARFSS